VAALEHLAESTLSDDAEQLEVLEPRIILLALLEDKSAWLIPSHTGLHFVVFLVSILFFRVTRLRVYVVFRSCELLISQSLSFVELHHAGRVFLALHFFLRNQILASVSKLRRRHAVDSPLLVLLSSGKSSEVGFRDLVNRHVGTLHFDVLALQNFNDGVPLV